AGVSGSYDSALAVGPPRAPAQDDRPSAALPGGLGGDPAGALYTGSGPGRGVGVVRPPAAGPDPPRNAGTAAAGDRARAPRNVHAFLVPLAAPSPGHAAARPRRRARGRDPASRRGNAGYGVGRPCAPGPHPVVRFSGSGSSVPRGPGRLGPAV